MIKMNRKEGYKDIEKWKKTRYKQNKRYYSKTAYNVNHRKKWTDEEIKLVLEHVISDTELSRLIGRSVGAIQKKRYKMKEEKNGRLE